MLIVTKKLEKQGQNNIYIKTQKHQLNPRTYKGGGVIFSHNDLFCKMTGKALLQYVLCDF